MNTLAMMPKRLVQGLLCAVGIMCSSLRAEPGALSVTQPPSQTIEEASRSTTNADLAQSQTIGVTDFVAGACRRSFDKQATVQYLLDESVDDAFKESIMACELGFEPGLHLYADAEKYTKARSALLSVSLALRRSRPQESLSPDYTRLASLAFETLGDEAATNLAAVKIRAGEDPSQVEEMAYSGHRFMLERYGANDYRTVAAALVLSKAKANAGKNRDAEILADFVLHQRRMDPMISPFEISEALIEVAKYKDAETALGLIRDAKFSLNTNFDDLYPIYRKYNREARKKMLRNDDISRTSLYANAMRERQMASHRWSLEVERNEKIAMLTLQEAILEPDPAKRRIAAKAAREIDPLLKLAYNIEALAAIMEAKWQPNWSEIFHLLDSGSPFDSIPLSTEESITSNSAWGIYYLTHKPPRPEAATHLGKASSGAIERLRMASATTDKNLLEQMDQYRPIFFFEVFANWTLAAKNYEP